MIFRSTGSTAGRRVFPWYGTFREGKPPDILQKSHHSISAPRHIRNFLRRGLCMRMGGLQLGCMHYHFSAQEDRLVI